MSRADRRRRLRQLEKISESVSAQGISPMPELIECAAITALIDKEFGQALEPGCSARVIGLVRALHNKSMARGQGADQLACAKGCHLCCDKFVSADPPEIFAIADYIRGRAGKGRLEQTIAQLEEANAPAQGLDVVARKGAGLMCALLVDGMCSVYPARPSACSAYCSLSLEACEAFARDEPVSVPQPMFAVAATDGYNGALWSVMKHRGLDSTAYEMVHAVLLALKDPGLEERWLAGERVFDGVASDATNDPDTAEDIQRGEWWAQTLWDVAHGNPPPESPFAQALPDWCF